MLLVINTALTIGMGKVMRLTNQFHMMLMMQQPLNGGLAVYMY